MSELELLYSKACGLPIYVKENKKLEGKISSTKVDVSLHNRYFLRFIFLLYCLYMKLFFLSKVHFLIYICRYIFFIRMCLSQLK